MKDFQGDFAKKDSIKSESLHDQIKWEDRYQVKSMDLNEIKSKSQKSSDLVKRLEHHQIETDVNSNQTQSKNSQIAPEVQAKIKKFGIEFDEKLRQLFTKLDNRERIKHDVAYHFKNTYEQMGTGFGNRIATQVETQAEINDIQQDKDYEYWYNFGARIGTEVATRVGIKIGTQIEIEVGTRVGTQIGNKIENQIVTEVLKSIVNQKALY